MKKYQYILLDLDGTLTDPAQGITNSICHALKHWGMEESDRNKLYRFIGPPLKQFLSTITTFLRHKRRKRWRNTENIFR